MHIVVQRSMLILPAHVPKFVEKAHLRGADAVVLDLEDAVPASEKAGARTGLARSVALVSRGGADVFIRVNNDPELLDEDLDAAVVHGLHGIFLPKTEQACQVAEVERRIAALELRRGMPAGTVRLALHVESPLGILNLKEIVSAGIRGESLSMGVDDYCLETGIRLSPGGDELLYAMNALVIAARSAGLHPVGVLGSVSDFGDRVAFEASAERARNLGCSGAYCIHPDQVTILNRVFSPRDEDVAHARRIVEAFEEGLRHGRAAIRLDNRMVDTPIYKRARRLMEYGDAIAAKERRKQHALDSPA
jgi:citrate lyase subunit beta / citryl-CoA lyase